MTKADKCDAVAATLALIAVGLLVCGVFVTKLALSGSAIVFAILALKFRFMASAHIKGKIQ